MLDNTRGQSMNVVILGAGIAGLSLAHFLDRNSIILERNEAIGGLCRSYNINGVMHDVGPHILFSKNKEILEIQKSLTEVHQLRRSNKILYKGILVKYPFENELRKEDFEGHGLQVFEGAMVSVLGTSLQNRDILKFFHDSTWNVIGLEMEGAHYQKAIQAAAKLRKSIQEDVKVRYAYYASDNPLETGSTLASGGLGTTGVKPTYLITEKILHQLFNV